MILSHQYKFIFIKTHKTAGTSIEIALSKYCDPQDVITPITSNDELSRKELGYRGRQNFRASLKDYKREDYAALLRGRAKRRFYNHMSAEEIKAIVDGEIWDRYYKFCFERNPWDKVVSHYYWAIKNKENPQTIKQFIDSGAPWRSKERGLGLYSIDGKVVVDKVFRYEHLSDDLKSAFQEIGIDGAPELPNAKSGHRKDKRSYREILDDEDREKVAKIFKDEIELMGYEF